MIAEEERGQLEEEFMDFCTSDLSLELHHTSETAVDAYWNEVGQVRDITGHQRFPLLTRLAKAILVIPHGNADVERSFSKMGLNKTKLRNKLSVDTMNALLQVQCNHNEPCYAFKPSAQMLTRCKNAVKSIQ